jgi:aryl-alcohol dehydrogenase-like predicted oxidoreductase
LKELKRRGIEVHARSVFLQGILLMDPAALPRYFDPVRDHIKRYRGYLNGLGMTPLAAALHFATSVPEVDSIICGVARGSELRQICAALRSPRKIPDFSQFAVDDPAILDPSAWVLRP